MKIRVALLMPYRIKDVKSLLSRDDIVDWEAYTAFSQGTPDAYFETDKEEIDNLMD